MNRFHRWYCGTGTWRRTLEQGLLPWTLGDVELGDDLLEVGPGPGLTTDVLQHRVARLTAIEVDERLARTLAIRKRSTNVTVVTADATAMPFPDQAFSGAVCFTMLHHVPSTASQNRLLREVHRVLAPGAWFVGSDSTPSLAFRLAHLFDTMVLVDPASFGARLRQAGFAAAEIKIGQGAFRFCARR
jgi:SAM-dependent methyltransferase